MMKDRKFVEDSYTRIQTQKIFEWAETQVKPTDKEISAEDFTKMVEEHQHHHH
jgi:trigger factor